MMRRFLLAFGAVCGLAAFLILALDGAESPVVVTLTSPQAGSTVSNVIQLTATASSLAGPIQRVEFYADDVLIGIAYGVPTPVKNVRIRKQ